LIFSLNKLTNANCVDICSSIFKCVFYDFSVEWETQTPLPSKESNTSSVNKIMIHCLAAS